MRDLRTNDKIVLEWILKDVGCVKVDLIHLAHDRHQWWVPVKRVSFTFHTKQTDY